MFIENSVLSAKRHNTSLEKKPNPGVGERVLILIQKATRGATDA